MAYLSVRNQASINSSNIYEQSLCYHNRIWNTISSLSEMKPASSNNLRLLHHNVRSLYKKMFYYESLNLFKSTDIFSVSETWLTPDIPNSLVDLPGFSIARCDRKSTTKTRGGGAALFVKSSYKFSIISQLSVKLSRFCDLVRIKIPSINNQHRYIIGLI